jgi:hypothetical protein
MVLPPLVFPAYVYGVSGVCLRIREGNREERKKERVRNFSTSGKE